MFDLFGIKEKHQIIVRGDVGEYAQGRISGLVEALVGSDYFEDSKLYDADGNHIMTVLNIRLTHKLFNEIWGILGREHPDACLFDM